MIQWPAAKMCPFHSLQGKESAESEPNDAPKVAARVEVWFRPRAGLSLGCWSVRAGRHSLIHLIPRLLAAVGKLSRPLESGQKRTHCKF